MADTTKHAQDIISTLPDELLQMILNKVSFEDAVRTSFLSRRWRNVWKSTSRIYFSQSREYALLKGQSWDESFRRKIAPFLDQFISIHQGCKIHSFFLEFTYEPYMADQVNSWIMFAVNKHVEILYLEFDVDGINIDDEEECYEVQPCVFQCNSLLKLTLSTCSLRLPDQDQFQLNNLQRIILADIDLSDNVIYRLTSNTPLLHTLIIEDCNTTGCLWIDVAPNPNFHTLDVTDGIVYKVETFIEINAPTVKKFALSHCLLPRTGYFIGDVGQCQKFQLVIDDEEYISEYYMDFESMLLQLLPSFQHTTTLKLCRRCIQLLSITESWNHVKLNFCCINLKLNTCFRTWELPGISYILKACPQIQNLVLLIEPEFGDSDEVLSLLCPFELKQYNKKEFWQDEKYSLTGHLPNLKAVKFEETRPGYQADTFNLDETFNSLELLQHLANSAKNLDHIFFF